jgi:hypothetical protein
MADEPGEFRMAGAYVEVSLRDNTQADEDAIRARIQGADAVTIATRLGAPDDKEFREKIKAATKEVGETSEVKVKVGLDEASAAAFEARIRALIASASRGSVSTPAGSSSSASSTAEAVASGGAGGGGGFGALIPAAIGLGAGAIGGVALAAIPAVFTAIGVAAEHSNPQVVQSFSDMTAAAKKSLQDGFQPLVPAIVDLANEGNRAIAGLTP